MGAVGRSCAEGREAWRSPLTISDAAQAKAEKALAVAVEAFDHALREAELQDGSKAVFTLSRYGKTRLANSGVSERLEFYGLRNACLQLCCASTAWNAALPSRWAFTSR
jgi:hypothetical protein